MRLIDSHHHLWHLAARPQPWMTGVEMTPLRRDFDVADLAAAAAGHALAGAVVVQTVADITETEELLDLAEDEPLLAGVVGYVDVGAADVDEQLDRLSSRSTGHWLVGVRSLVQYETDPNWLRRPHVIAGLRAVAARGLTHDLLIVPPQIEAAVEAVSVVPEGRFVIDHLAKPQIATGAWQPWADNMAALASRQNVWAKVSGLVTEANWDAWTIDDLRPYVNHAIESFGARRLMFGSDWPVCTVTASYDRVLRSIKQLTAALADDDLVGFFGGNATVVYSLDDRLVPSTTLQEPR